jgi:hypothetical protein
VNLSRRLVLAAAGLTSPAFAQEGPSGPWRLTWRWQVNEGMPWMTTTRMVDDARARSLKAEQAKENPNWLIDPSIAWMADQYRDIHIEWVRVEREQ